LELGVCGWGQPGGDEALGAGKGEGGLGEEEGGEAERVGGRGHEDLSSVRKRLLGGIEGRVLFFNVLRSVKCRVVPAKQSIRVLKLDLKEPSARRITQ